MKLRPREIVILVLAVLILTGVGVSAALRPQPVDAEPYHEHVREVANRLPLRIGPWVATETELPPAAVKLLRPNIMRALDFYNEETGEEVSLLLVQTKDARDMIGHYPPVCYPSHGWTVNSQQPGDWQVGSHHITGTEYDISYESTSERTDMTIVNFLVMPDGQFMRDMQGVKHAASDYRRHFFGSAQVQVVTPSSMTPQRREEVVRELIGANLELLDALGSAGRWTGPTTP